MQSHSFFGCGDEPMFRSGPLQELNVLTACNQLRIHALGVGLPYRLFHRLCHNFATQMMLLFGSATTRELMHHHVQNNSLNHNYTGGIELFDLVGIWAGESQQQALIEASNQEDAILSGFAHCCIVVSLLKDPIDPRENAGPIAKGLTMPAARPTPKQIRSHEEQVQYALQTNSAFAWLHSQYLAAALELEKLLELKLPYSRKAQDRPVS